MFAVPLAERVRRTVETVEILRKAWTGERFSHEGKVYSFDRVKVTPAPERPDGGTIPIYLGGMVEPAIRRAGRLADGWIRTRGIGRIDDVRRDVSKLEEAARAAGRDPATLGFAQLQSTFVWDDGDPWEVAGDAIAHQAGIYRGWDEGGDTPERGFVLPEPDVERLRRSTVTGTPQEVAHVLRPFVEAFGTRSELHLIVRLHYPGMDFPTASRAMELFAERAMPALEGA